MQVRSRIMAVLAPATVMLAVGTGAGSLAVSAGAATATSAAGGIALAPGQIEMGASGQCVTASSAVVQATVVLSACKATRTLQRWTLHNDGTISLNSKPALLLSADPLTHVVVLNDNPASPDSQWFPQADKTLVNIGLSTDPQDQLVLDHFATGGVTLHVFADNQNAINQGREQYPMLDTIYASTKLTNRPDSGDGGNTWALDTITRLSSVTTLGSGGFEASVVDNGTFETVPSATGNSTSLTPDQSTPGDQIGDALIGSIHGTWGFSFTAGAAPSAAHMPHAVNGVGTSTTGTWYEQFFPAKTTFGGAGGASSGPEAWSWIYTSNKDNCGNVETWLDAANTESGNIPAPAPGDCGP
jgi:hypothetical protein